MIRLRQLEKEIEGQQELWGMRFVAFEYHKGTGHPEYDIPGPSRIVHIPWMVMEDAVCSRQEEADRVWGGPYSEEWDNRNGYIIAGVPKEIADG